MLKKYDAGFYVVTPSKYLHEFKTDDDFAKDPSPENSLYLPDCLIGAVDGVKFNVRGKDSSGSSFSNKMARSHEFAFKAHTAADAQKWHSVIASVAGQTTNEAPDSTPSSPAGKTEVCVEKPFLYIPLLTYISHPLAHKQSPANHHLLRPHKRPAPLRLAPLTSWPPRASTAQTRHKNRRRRSTTANSTHDERKILTAIP